MRILIAEDDAISRRVLLAQLNKLGHEVLVAEDGKQAYELYQREPVQVVITDWMMPEMDGIALCKLIRSEQKEHYTYILMLTALAGKKNYLEGMEAGADDFVAKPFDKDELHARLRAAERILSLQKEVKLLGDLLPICAWCKKVRDDQGFWSQVESYISKHTGTNFSHGICPNCVKGLMTETAEKKIAI